MCRILLCACVHGVKSEISLDTGNQISAPAQQSKIFAPAPPSKTFLAPARAMQNCFGSGSTALLRILGSFVLGRVAGQFQTNLSKRTYPSFEIILEMGSVHWIECQIQCYMQIQKHSVRYELCFKKHIIA